MAIPGASILTAAEMREAEQRLFASGVPEFEVMERAGAACAEYIWRIGGHRSTLILCGPGNNGGDGFVIARILKERGVPVRVAATGESGTQSSRRARENWAGPVEDIFTAKPALQLVDALFGTGLTRGLDGKLAARLAELAGKAKHSYAIDMPSGMDSNSGKCLSPVPVFDLCITLGSYKPSHFLQPGASRFHDLVCADIGIDASGGSLHSLAKPRLQAPTADSHKYNRGLTAIVGGYMAGASILAAEAAARAGAGYVKYLGKAAGHVATNAIVQTHAPDRYAVRDILADDRISAVLAGPGLGRDEEAWNRLESALHSGHPLVLDADALVLLADRGEDRLDILMHRPILTPHEGEFARLFPGLKGSKVERARQAAVKAKGVIIYKGPDTVIAAPDGQAWIAPLASPWLSTAGTGDVLAGLCAAQLAVTRDPVAAARNAVWLQAEAARRAGAAFVADDLIAHVPAALAACL
ncbi:NAD(P)H-hydrate dehydratase [Rhizorhapis sp.]|uniref:NAD(P)H-hydrate dehydratase n=1 Tax=Rhizorhapis sp. TaxID=1968842 RepID=UPI002B481839|nr:NAD(P)H-hydrate dehydratase [Rhizorhapis sp.]HKR16871.1 NAD(P)H-hydrate dehydratase [Rhizorhapis sp.]